MSTEAKATWLPLKAKVCAAVSLSGVAAIGIGLGLAMGGILPVSAGLALTGIGMATWIFGFVVMAVLGIFDL